MTDFFKKMPRPEAGKYNAVVIRTNPFSGGHIVWEKRANGRLRAYLYARFMALLVDIKTPFWDGEIGIDWQVRKI